MNPKQASLLVNSQMNTLHEAEQAVLHGIAVFCSVQQSILFIYSP